MTIPLLEHVKGCTPVHRCASCILDDYLRKTLKRAEYDAVVEKLEALAGRPADKPLLSVGEFQFINELRRIMKRVAGVPNFSFDEIVAEVIQAPLNTTLASIKVPKRLCNAIELHFGLHRRAVIGDALRMSESEILRLTGVGHRSLNVLKDALKDAYHQLGVIPKRRRK